MREKKIKYKSHAKVVHGESSGKLELNTQYAFDEIHREGGQVMNISSAFASSSIWTTIHYILEEKKDDQE